MPIIFDLIIIGIFALSIFIGYKQGLLKAIIKLFSFFIAIIVALVLYRPISNAIINNTSIDDNIKNVMVEKITPDNIQNTEENITTNLLYGAETSVEEVANTFTVNLINIVVILILFILVRIILIIVIKLTDIITKLPLLKQANKLGGSIFGVLRGVVLIYTILAVVYLISPLISNNVKEGIDKSLITSTLYNNNIILNILL